VCPIHLKKLQRIEAMLFLYFVALMIISLIERNIRKKMRESKPSDFISIPKPAKSIATEQKGLETVLPKKQAASLEYPKLSQDLNSIALPILPQGMKTTTPTWANIKYLFRNVHQIVIAPRRKSYANHP